MSSASFPENRQGARLSAVMRWTSSLLNVCAATRASSAARSVSAAARCCRFAASSAPRSAIFRCSVALCACSCHKPALPHVKLGHISSDILGRRCVSVQGTMRVCVKLVGRKRMAHALHDSSDPCSSPIAVHNARARLPGKACPDAPAEGRKDVPAGSPAACGTCRGRRRAHRVALSPPPAATPRWSATRRRPAAARLPMSEPQQYTEDQQMGSRHTVQHCSRVESTPELLCESRSCEQGLIRKACVAHCSSLRH